MRKVVAAIILGLSFSASSVALAQSPSSVVQIAKDANIYTETGSGFKRAGKAQDAGLQLPLKILKSSPKGFVSVNGPDGTVWLDKQDLKFNQPGKMVGACAQSISGPSTASSASSRGAGQGCD